MDTIGVGKNNVLFPNKWNDSTGVGHETLEAKRVLVGGGNAAGGMVSIQRGGKELQQQRWPQLLILVAWLKFWKQSQF